VGTNVLSWQPKQYHAQFKHMMEKCLETGEPQEIEVMGTDAKGEPAWFLGRIGPFIRNGEITAFTLVAHDITKLKKAEEKLRLQANLLQAVGQAVIATDVQGNIIYWNQMAETMYGWQSHEVIGKQILEVTPTDQSLEEAAAIMEQMLQGKEWAGEFYVKDKQGREFPVMITNSPVFDAQGEVTAIIGVSTDISDRIELERQLLQAQKMEAVGQLAGGLAHDFNNILTVILGNADFGLKNLKSDDVSHDFFEEIKNAAEKARGLTNQLLSFGRKKILKKSIVDVNDIIHDLLKMVRRILGEDILLKTKLSSNLQPVCVDPGQIQQVFLNLCTNARDAMHHGGQITITTKNIFPPASSQDDESIPDSFEPLVEITISDTGTGMDAATLSRAFEPFFSTKKPGKGTGLGLSFAYGIIEQHKGHLNVKSEVGKGTTFEIYLPATTATKTDLPDTPKVNQVAGNGKTILVVEDEELVRNVVLRILKSFGYKPLMAKNATEGFALFKKRKEEIALVLTDVVMPGGNGVDMVAKIKTIQRDVPVVFVTGYDAEQNLDLETIQIRPDYAVLQKPYSREMLGQVIDELLKKNQIEKVEM